MLLSVIAAAVLIAGAAGVVAPRTVASAATPRATASTVWLCRPGMKAENPCDADRTATVVRSDGSQKTEKAVPAHKRKIDCFYVYPTVSEQPGPNADLHRDPAQLRVATAQASRFSQACKVYAPMYRQMTLSSIGGAAPAAAAVTAYTDVQNAWRDYLAHDNHGRGVVLIGHSQGTFMLDQLLKREIDPKPKVRAQLVSALLLGGNVIVPKGKDVGGDFKHITACRGTKQTGCVVAFSTFDNPVPANSLFGRAGTGPRGAGTVAADSEVLCVNPAALRGGSASVKPYFPVHLRLGVLGGSLPATAADGIPKDWVTYPGLFTAKCVHDNGAIVLHVDDVRKPGDTRPALIDSLGPTWGQHLIDGNIALGNLVDLVESQGAAYERKQ